MSAEIRRLYVDAGPVEQAASILLERSTLADYFTIRADGDLFVIEPREGAITIDYAGSGTSALWKLLKAVVSSRFEASLYEVASCCDGRNRAVVVAAVTALCGGVA